MQSLRVGRRSWSVQRTAQLPEKILQAAREHVAPAYYVPLSAKPGKHNPFPLKTQVNATCLHGLEVWVFEGRIKLEECDDELLIVTALQNSNLD